MLLIAAVHVIGPGRYLEGKSSELYASYFSDLAIPFGYYFLLFLPPRAWPLLGSWAAKSAVVFLMAATAEALQYLGVPLLGSTFDPLDFAMYAIGVLSAAVLDRQVFARLFAFWPREKAEG
jgi:hypothetical protein